jgi:hypothetical protein
VAIGLVIVEDTNKVHEVSTRYDNVDDCEADWINPRVCKVTLDVDHDLDSPIFVYYEIRNMYQNHRLYTKSRDPMQLMGHSRSKSDVESNCQPIVTMNDLELEVDIPYTNGQVASPCGLIAKSYFNDTFSLLKPHSHEVVNIHQDDIAWSVERDDKFIHQDDWKQKQWVDVEDEHFMVWMNIAALPSFRKLWGHIEDDLDSGKYTVIIENQYDVDEFDGEKHIVLSTTGAFGGKVTFIGIAYLVVGAVTIFGSILFLAVHLLKRRLAP